MLISTKSIQEFVNIYFQCINPKLRPLQVQLLIFSYTDHLLQLLNKEAFSKGDFKAVFALMEEDVLQSHNYKKCHVNMYIDTYVLMSHKSQI